MHLIPIQITVQAATAADVRQLILDLAGTVSTMSPANIPVETTVSTVAACTCAVPAGGVHVEGCAYYKAPKTKKAAAPVVETVEEEEPAIEAEGTEEVDDVAIRSLASSKSKTAGKPAVKAVLEQFGVASVTAVPQTERPAFMAALNAL